MKKSPFFLFFLGIAMFCSVGFARNLTLSDATDLILEQSNDIKKAEANIKKMQATVDQVSAGRFFKLDAVASYNNYLGFDGFTGPTQLPAGIDNIGTLGVTVSQPIYTFGKIGYALAAAKKSLGIAEISKRLAEVETRSAAISLYWSAKMADELVAISDRSLKNTKNAQRQLTATGRANRSNLVKISADVAAREIEFQDAKYNRDAAFRILKAYAGIDDSEQVVLVTDFPKDFEPVQKKEILPLEWKIYEQTAKLYDAEKWSNYMGYAPTLVATGAYDYNTAAGSSKDLFGAYQQSARIGLAVQWTLFDGGAKMAQATSSAASAIAAREELDKLQKLMTAEYDNLINKHSYLRESLQDINKASELADKAYELSRARFLAGQTSATELADTERAQAQMAAAVLNAKFQIVTTAETIKKIETSL